MQTQSDGTVPVPLPQEAHQSASEGTVHPATRAQIQTYFAGTILKNPVDEFQQCRRGRKRGWTDQPDPVLILPFGCIDSSLHDQTP